MATHRRESSDRAPSDRAPSDRAPSDRAPSSHRKVLAIIVLAGMLTIGFVAAALTDSYLIGLLVSLSTGACIVVAHLMIAPGAITESVPPKSAARHSLSHRPRLFEIRHG